jgi:predicted metalloprotease with PDZ domain
MIRYTLSIQKPEWHLVDVSVEVENLSGESVDFHFPAWSPGSYLIRDYAKNVVKAEAFSLNGIPLSCRKTAKDVWRVYLSGNHACLFSYQVYCYEIGVQNSFVDESHATLHGPSLFAYVEGRKNEPCRLTLQFPESWKKISTGLESVENLQNTFEAPDYDTFLDSPIEIGNHDVYTFFVRHVPHHVALFGKGNLEPETFVADIQKIVESAISVFQDIPYKHYTFLIQLLPDRGGGLEHLNSTLIQVGRWSFKPEEEYRKVLSLVSHEFFHLWNVKRLAPKPLLHFDYTKENYTDLLWIAEGFTSYYEDLILLRAGLYTVNQYFESVLEDYKAYCESPGRLLQSACETSFDTWIKFYKLGDSFRNLSVSYYRKGALLGLALDLLIRNTTQNRFCLDDVLRFLYEETYRKSWTGYTLQDFKEACFKISGNRLEDFFKNYVEGTKEFLLEDFLKLAGLRLIEKKEKDKTPEGYLGIEWRKTENRILVSTVLWNTPAFESGISPGDEIVAWDRFRVYPETFPKRVLEATPGSVHRLQIFHQDCFKEVEVCVAEKPKEWKIESLEDVEEEMLQLREKWLGTREIIKEEKKETAKIS